MIPPKANAQFAAAMEDTLDETSKQLVAETRTPVPMRPGRPARTDYEYQRNGTANLFSPRSKAGAM